MKTVQVGEFYADFDEETGLHCVFHTDTYAGKPAGFAFASFADKQDAEDNAQKRNK